MTDKLILWEPSPADIIPSSAKTLTEITQCAIQLTAKDQRQIARALEARDYEMGVNYLWIKSMAALKRELGTLGAEFLGEMLNRADVDDDDDAQDILSDKDALRLAEELGIITSIESLRLRQTQELVAHFSQNEFREGSDVNDDMDEIEAARSLKACISNILGKPHIEVAQRFVEFRQELLNSQLNTTSHTIELLSSSPYFFRKLSISILLSSIKTSIGASLEIALGNLNVVLPILWPLVRETEKWQVGQTYRDVYTAGNSIATQGVKNALLKVHGFDFVPESIRSDTFIKAAELIIKAHEGIDNFYNEESPVKALDKLGTVIPAPALASCTSALLSVALGNFYGSSYFAAPKAIKILEKYTSDRWQYYLDQCLPGDLRILDKLDSPKPRSKWIRLAIENKFDKLSLKNQNIQKLVDATIKKNDSKIVKLSDKIAQRYYGKQS